MPFPQRNVPERSDIPDVFQDNAQNILQKASVSNMIGLLQQLNKISMFASEVFTDILATTTANNQRISQIKTRLNKLEDKVPSTEQMFLVNSPSYFYDNPFAGKEWQRKDPLRGLLFRRDRATKAVNRRRDVALPLPDLSALDRISVSGPCVKKFSDSNFFMNEWLEAEKRKMEEEKKKKKERKKKRKKKKRQKQQTIQGIAKDYFDPVTGKKIVGKAKEIKAADYNLTDTNTASTDFASADGSSDVYANRMANSRVAQMANTQKKEKKQKKAAKQQKKAQQQPPTVPTQAHQSMTSYAQIPNAAKVPPPVPGGGGPPPVPSAAVPPPVPQQAVDDGLDSFRKMAKMRVPKPAIANKMRQSGIDPGVIQHYEATGQFGGGGGGSAAGGPPPVPSGAMVPPPAPGQQQRLSPMQMAMQSTQHAQASGAYNKPKPQMVPGRSQALLAGIKGGMKLKKAVQVKREPVQDSRSILMNALRKKGKTGLKHVKDEEKNVKKEEEVDNTIYAILNRRKFMAEDSDSESSDGSWGSSEED